MKEIKFLFPLELVSLKQSFLSVSFSVLRNRARAFYNWLLHTLITAQLVLNAYQIRTRSQKHNVNARTLLLFQSLNRIEIEADQTFLIITHE